LSDGVENIATHEYMKQIILIAVLVLTSCIIGFGQDSKIKVEPIPGSKPFIATNAEFEKLKVAASMDRFGKISDKEKKVRLDRFISIISAKNHTVEYVIELRGKTPADVSQNMEFTYRYLTENKKIKPSRISFAITAESANDTELWLIPNNNISIPPFTDCVIISAEDEEKLKEYFQIKKSGNVDHY